MERIRSLSDIQDRAEGTIQPRLLNAIPRKHQSSDDTRLLWLWNQRLAVVQNIYLNSTDLRDKMAATVILTATIGGGQLPAIELLLRRLEGGAVSDETIQEKASTQTV